MDAKDSVMRLLARQATAGWSVAAGSGYGGFYGDVENGHGLDEKYRYVRFERTEGPVACVVILNVSDAEKWTSPGARFAGLLVEGHTVVNGGTFTRMGIDCASVWLQSEPDGGAHDYGDVASLLAGEFERCRLSVERKKSAVAVPGLPFSKQPEWFKQAGSDLNAGKTVTLSPHGMGTGYILRRLAARTGKLTSGARGRVRAEQALERMLGASPVYVETYDHD